MRLLRFLAYAAAYLWWLAFPPRPSAAWEAEQERRYRAYLEGGQE